jgi:hypothetical protein
VKVGRRLVTMPGVTSMTKSNRATPVTNPVDSKLEEQTDELTEELTGMVKAAYQ